MRLPRILKRVLPEGLLAVCRIWHSFWVVRSMRAKDQRQLSPDLIITVSPAATFKEPGDYALSGS
jgi:hypothetical protein